MMGQNTNPKNNSKTVWIVVGILAALLAALLAWGMLKMPYAPADSPGVTDSAALDSASEPTIPPEQIYPDLYSIEVNDFMMSVDGSFSITSRYGFHNLGWYLPKNMTLEPALPFTIQARDKEYIVHVEGGKELTEPLAVRFQKDPLDEWAEDVVINVMPHFAVRLQTEQGVGGAQIDKPVTLEFSKPVESSYLDSLAGSGMTIGISESGSRVSFTSKAVDERHVLLTPSEMLEYSSVYVITLPETAVKANDGDAFLNVEILEFETERRAFSLTIQNQRTGAFLPDEAPLFLYRYEQNGENAIPVKRDVSVAMFKFPDAQSYSQYLAQALNSGYNSIYSDAALLDTIRENAPSIALETVFTPRVVPMMPGVTDVTFDKLDKGFYLLESSVEDGKTHELLKSYKAFQVTTMDVYMQMMNGQALLWLNDSSLDSAASGYTVSFYDAQQNRTVSCVTDDDATAILEGDSIQQDLLMNSGLFTVSDQQGDLLYIDRSDTLVAAGTDGRTINDQFYSFFYLDRAIYRPTDTISFWGYVKPYKYNKKAAPTSVVVTMDEGGLDESIDVRLDSDGFFSGEIKLSKMVSGEYMVTLQLPTSFGENRYLKSSYITVNEYHKPMFSIESSVDKLIYQGSETVTVDVSPSFYDGTPLPNYELEFSVFNSQTGEFEQVQTIKTDDKGVAKATLAAGAGQRESEISWKPRYGYYYAKISSDGETVTHRGDYVYVPGRVALDMSVEFNARQTDAALIADAYEVTLENIKTDEDVQRLFDTDAKTRDEAIRALFGKRYGDLETTVRFNYQYADATEFTYSSDNVVKQLNIKDGHGELPGLLDFKFAKDRYMYIYAVLSYSQDGNVMQDETNASNSATRRWYDSSSDGETAAEGYYFDVGNSAGLKSLQVYEQYRDRMALEVDVGERLTFALYENGAEVRVPKGARILYTVLQNGIIDRGFSDSPSFSLAATQEYAVNTVVVAAYFDGRHVRTIKDCEISISYDSLELDVDVTADKESYRPGESVRLTANVHDKNGNPVKARVCFSVVDESVFALNEQYIDVRDSLYSNMWFSNSVIWKYTTASGDINPFANPMDGGKGEGDSMAAYDVLRKNFKDTAIFKDVNSNDSGVASITFTLPDNLTSWRVTTLAISANDSRGGSVKRNFISTMPFFSNPVLSDKYLDGDEVSMLIQGHGTALEQGGEINYTVRVTGNDVDETYTRTGKAYESVQLSLGKLKSGDYTVTSTAEFGQMRDTVELPLSVVANNLELVVNEKLDLTKPVDIKAMRFPVTITFYQREYEAYYTAMSSLLTHYCQRLDQAMARNISKLAITKQSQEAALPRHLLSDIDVSAYQTADGGVGWYQGSDYSDPILTANVLMIAPDSLDAARVEKYLLAAEADYNMTDEDHARVVAALYTLSASKYGGKAREILNDDSKDMQARYAVLCALALRKDADAAEYYDKLVAPYISQTSDGVKWIDYYETQDNVTQKQQNDNHAANDTMTALAMSAAARLGRNDDADAFELYLGRYSWGLPYIFETMAYVQSYDRKVEPVRDFSYTSAGQNHTVSMGAKVQSCMVLNESQMRDFALHNVPDSVAAMAFYIGEPDEAGLQVSENFTIDKQIEEISQGRYQNTVTITFGENAPLGEYDISDWIPSSMRLYSMKMPDNMWVSRRQEGQKMYFNFTRDIETRNTLEITYVTQRTFDTPAVCDRTYLMNVETGEIAYSERTSI